jgi:hypothetical protein
MYLTLQENKLYEFSLLRKTSSIYWSETARKLSSIGFYTQAFSFCPFISRRQLVPQLQEVGSRTAPSTEEKGENKREPVKVQATQKIKVTWGPRRGSFVDHHPRLAIIILYQLALSRCDSTVVWLTRLIPIVFYFLDTFGWRLNL